MASAPLSPYQQLYQTLMQQLQSDISSGALHAGSSNFAPGSMPPMSSPMPPPQPLPFGGVAPGGFKGGSTLGKGPPQPSSQQIWVQGKGGHYASVNGVPYATGMGLQSLGTAPPPPLMSLHPDNIGKGISAAHLTFASSPFYPTYHKTCHSCGFAANLQRYRWCNRCRVPFGGGPSPMAGGPQLLTRQGPPLGRGPGPPKVLPTTYTIAKSDPYATFVSPSPTQVSTGPPSTPRQCHLLWLYRRPGLGSWGLFGEWGFPLSGVVCRFGRLLFRLYINT